MKAKTSTWAEGVNNLLKLENYRMSLCMLYAVVQVSKRRLNQKQIDEITKRYCARCDEFGADDLCGAGDSILIDECRSCGIPAFDPVMEDKLIRLEQNNWLNEVHNVRYGQNYATATSVLDRVMITDYRVVLVMMLCFHDVLGFGGIKRLPEVYRIATETRQEDLAHQGYGIYPDWLFKQCAGARIEGTDERFEQITRRICTVVERTKVVPGRKIAAKKIEITPEQAAIIEGMRA